MDGSIVQIRTARPDDFDRAASFFDGLSSESLYLRFFSAHRPTAEEIRRIALGQHPHTTAIVAVRDDEIVAIASSVAAADGQSAEVSFAVADRHQHLGLGTLLLEHLAVLARRDGIGRFTAVTLFDNALMQNVFRASGFDVHSTISDGVYEISMNLDLQPPFATAVAAREQHAEAESIRRLLNPRSVAVIGASNTEGSVGRALFENLRATGFTGRLRPVNPKAMVIQGVDAVASVTDIDEAIDLAVIAVPARVVPEVLDQCGQKGAHAAVIVTAGFAEADGDGRAKQHELVAIARGHGMRLVGPNCIGLANTDPDFNLNATFSPIGPTPGSVGFASQSGAMGIAALAHCEARGIGLSSFVSLGNKADVSSNDLLQYWETDPRTTVAALYLESFGNPQKFARIARRFTRTKPLVVIKAGRTEVGRAAAASHTAALSSNDDLTDALFAEAGITRVDTMAEFFDVIQYYVHQPLPAGRRIAVVGNSGGPGILAADACVAAGLDVPVLADDTLQRLSEACPQAIGRNPIDLIAAAQPDEYRGAIDAVLADDAVDAVVAIYTDPMVSDGAEIAEAIVAGSSASAKPVVASFLAAGVGPVLERGSAGSAIPVYDFPEAATRALGRAAALARVRRQPPGSPPDFDDLDADAVDDLITRRREARGSHWLTPPDLSAVLGSYGIPTVGLTPVTSAEEAAAAAEAVAAPVALKVQSDTIVHKTDVGGVILDLATPADVAAAFDAMKARLGSDMTGAVVQPMVDDGVEVIIGLLQDPTFGPVLMFGTGGTHAELWRDRAHALVPLTVQGAAQLVQRPRGAALLQGYRGAPPVALAALEELVLRMSELAVAHPSIAELELNPVIVTPTQCAVVDARCRVADPADREHPEWRRLPDHGRTEPESARP